MSKEAAAEQDFVYAGQRLSSGNDRYIQIHKIKDDGTLEEANFYKWDKSWKSRMVGGVYTGASFDNEGSAFNLKDARWKNQWPIQEDRIAWQSLDAEADDKLRSKSMESDAKRVSEIQEIMLPLRKIYESYSDKYDRSGCRALEKLVMDALRTPPRKSELE